MPVRTFLFILVICVGAQLASAQAHIFLRGFKTDSLGNRTASAVYFDSKGKIGVFRSNELQIKEGGIPARIISVTCKPPGPETAVSSVLTVDVSGSMRFGGPNIRLATRAAHAWVDALNDSSEAAVTAFDHSALLQSDFTGNVDQLNAAIDRLHPRGGTSYERGLLDSVMGGIAIARGGIHRRVIVFLTDGFGSVDADSVIAKAMADSITIYCVTLGLNMPGVLQRIAEATGGLWFDNVTTIEQAVEAYQRIFADATGAGGCEVVWEPPAACTEFTDVTASVHGASYTTELRVPEQRRGGLEVSSSSVQFDSAGQTVKTLSIINRAVATRIDRVGSTRSDVFAIDASTMPRTLNPGDTLRVNVRCLRLDSSYIVAELVLQANPCPLPTVYLAAGNPSLPPDRKTLRVVYPNGGERIPTRSRDVLRWEGLPPDVPIRVEVSTDAGRSWDVVSEREMNLKRDWNSGQLPSDSCLLRVTHVKPKLDVSKPIYTLVGRQFSAVEFSPDGSILVTGEASGLSGTSAHLPPVTIWNATNGQQVKQLGHGQEIAFSKDGRRLITWGRDSVTMYAMPTGTPLWSIPVKGLPTRCVLSTNGSTVIVGGGDGDKTLVVDAATGVVKAELSRKWPSINWVDITADASLVAVCERDSIVRVFRLADPTTSQALTEPGVLNYYRAVFSPDGKQLITSSSTGSTSKWDTKTFSKPITITSRFYKNDNTYIAFSPDGRRMAIETGRDQTMIADVATGNHVVSIRRLSEPGGAFDARILDDGSTLLLSTVSFATAFDAHTGVQLLRVQRGFGVPSAPSDGSKMAVISASATVNVYDLDSPLLQQDTSDNYWSLYRAIARIDPVRLHECAVGQSVDSIVVDAITNVSADPVTVKGLRIEGAQASDFGVNAPKEFVLAPGEVYPLTYSFHPEAVGERAALIVAETNSGIINARISGRCPGGVIQAGGTSRDLGLVPIGETVRLSVDDMIKNEGLQPVRVREVRIAPGSDPAIKLVSHEGFSLDPGSTRSFDVEVTAPSKGTYATQVEFLVNGLDEPVQATIYARADTLRFIRGDDPTTFRSIMLPSAVVPEAGTLTTGVYDVLGLSVGYSITDNVAILAGGALPLYKKWFGATGYDASYSAAWSIGAKVGYQVHKDWIVGGGYQFGQSVYDQELTEALDSKITFNAVWATAGYGTDNSRLNIYLGYAFKDHVTIIDGHFRADATIVGLAYDYRFAQNWKVCAETFFMRTMTFVPITLVARYFRETDAFEFGFTVMPSASTSTQIPIVPMVTWVKRW